MTRKGFGGVEIGIGGGVWKSYLGCWELRIMGLLVAYLILLIGVIGVGKHAESRH